MATIEMCHLKKEYGLVTVIPDLDLSIDQGSFTVFVGPSGCGKSTLLRMIAGLEEISGGDLFIGGKRVNDLPPAERGIAMVFQSYALYPHMDVYGNLSFGLKLAKKKKAEIEKRVHRAAEILEMIDLLHRYPRQLSGGQCQRVAIGRAIVRNPDVFLFDEPLSNLDAALRVQMRIELARLHAKIGATMVYVTHDQVEAMTLADTIVVLNQGRIEQVGAPMEIYHHPINEFVAAFIGSPKMNFLESHILEANPDEVICDLPGNALIRIKTRRRLLPTSAPVRVGVRPEHLSFCDQDKCELNATIYAFEQLGDLQYAYAELPDGQSITVRSIDGRPLTIGDRISLSATQCHLFDAQGEAIGGTAVEDHVTN